MLSIFHKIKNKILSKKEDKRHHKYHMAFDNEIMTVDLTNDSNDTIDLDESSAPPPPLITQRLFNIEVDENVIKSDYELQDLLLAMRIYQYDVKNVILESKIEEAIHNIPNASDMMKIKLKLLYIIIANNIYRNIFDEKKQYISTRTKQYIGVFRYNDYIIRIDDSPYSFINESDVVRASSTTLHNNNIIRPFLIYTNIRRNFKNEICDCASDTCQCKYEDDHADNYADNYSADHAGINVSRISYNKLRQNTISFSIQHYVKDSVSMYNWVKDNMGVNMYNRFSSIQHPFFIHLFHQCALLLREIHNVSVVHADIKPDNILIREHPNFNINHPEKCKNFTVFLIDFGLSGIHNVGVGTGGTIPYCHPEFKNIIDTNRSSKYNWKTINKKHDVWSLGISFLTMYIYRDFYNYYHKYPAYFFTKNGYVSSLIIDVITHDKLNQLFTRLLSAECISSDELCDLLQEMAGSS
jgi:serine/threonine protein kinase